MSSTPSGEDPARSRAEQPDPERAYRDALATLDSALRQLAATPHAGSFQASAADPPRGWGWRQRLSALAWRRAPLLRQQRAFNAVLVDTLTGFVRHIDSRDRALAAAIDRLANDAAGARDRLAADFSAALGGAADEMLKRWESLAAREQRREAQLDEVRQAATAWRQVTGALRQELDRLRAQPSPAASPAHAAAQAGQPDAGTQLATPRDSFKYVGFEDRFRGAAVDIRAGLAGYARHFEGASDVLDAGCGRGEFLEILRERGVSASGIDLNPEMVAQCRERGLEVAEGDLLAHLAALPNASLGGLFAAQVLEHLEPAYLLKFIDTAFLKLRPGARIVLETINVASWTAFFQSYVRDITHVRPLHPDTLAYLVTAGGFQQVEVVYRSPIPPEHRLARAPEPANADETLDRMTAVFNRNVDELNRLLFADQDYAVVAQRG